MLSRFRNPKEQKETVEGGWRPAKLDVVIGTHRILSKDVANSRISASPWWTRSNTSG